MNFHRIAFVLLILPVSLIVGPHLAQTAPAQSASLLLTEATIIDGSGGPAVANAWIRIEGDRIAEVGSGTPPRSTGAEVISLAGKTVVPGLADMHVHLGDLEQARWMLKLFLAHGVTNIKESGNQLGNLSAIRRWMASESPLPHVFMSGRTLNGVRNELEFLKEGRETESRLEDNGAFGVQFIKIHNFVSSQALRQIVDFCEANDLYLTGHVPLSMTSVGAIDTGMKILEHVRIRPAEVLDDPEIIAQFPIDILVLRRTSFWAHLEADGSSVRRTLGAWEKRKDQFFIDPTLVVHWALAHSDRKEITEPPELSMVSPAMRNRWARGIERYGKLTPEQFAEAKQAVANMGRFIAMAHDRGVRVTTGTDTAVNWVVPGFSLHQELELMVEGGLTPVQAIHASTGQVALALRRDDRGVIAAGKRADLVIVDGNVADNIKNIRNVERVMLGGKLHESSDLMTQASTWASQDLPSPEEGETD